jgi:hypothetical protein
MVALFKSSLDEFLYIQIPNLMHFFLSHVPTHAMCLVSGDGFCHQHIFRWHFAANFTCIPIFWFSFLTSIALTNPFAALVQYASSTYFHFNRTTYNTPLGICMHVPWQHVPIMPISHILSLLHLSLSSPVCRGRLAL